LEKYEITALRIELIKEQILKKLRLKGPPSVSMPLSTLPKPLSNGAILHKSNKLESNRDVEDFYGTTDQIILFPQEGKWNIIILTVTRVEREMNLYMSNYWCGW
jgi:hypothetical protein